LAGSFLYLSADICTSEWLLTIGMDWSGVDARGICS